MSVVMNVKEIKSCLPYTYPMLLLDRVEVLDDNHAWAVKNLSINEGFFQGHFPGHAIMPGVLQVEAMKQLAEVLVSQRLSPAGEQSIYIRVLEKVKFRNPQNPGDRMKIEVELISIENNEAVLQCKTSNKSGVTCEAKMTLALRDKIMPNTMPELYNEYDKCENTLMNTEAIQKFLPHRYPFLLVDNIVKIEDNILTATKNLTANEEIFQGCPEDYMTFPESLQCEMGAQAGCVCVLARPENQGKIGYFMTIDRAESFAPIFPGDQVVCELDIPAGKGRFGKGKGILKVKDKVVFEISLMFAIVDA